MNTQLISSSGYFGIDGPESFYLKNDYRQNTARELKQLSLIDPIYKFETEHKIWRIVKQIISYIIFPIAIYQWVHSFAARIAILPSSNTLNGYKIGSQIRSGLALDGPWKFKRFSIEVDGYQIDAMIMGTADTLANRRWVLFSNGNGELYEYKFCRSETYEMLTELKANALMFNYPGVGASSGPPDRQTMAKAYRAMLRFLEDRNKGIGAKEIIGYGHSMGGGVQGDALLSHPLQDQIRYVFVKSRTFSDLSAVASQLLKPWVGSIVRFFGWNIDSVPSSKQLAAPEVILQTARVASAQILKTSDRIIDDGIIPAQVSLGKALLDNPSISKTNKVVIGIPEDHNQPLSDLPFLSKQINLLLS